MALGWAVAAVLFLVCDSGRGLVAMDGATAPTGLRGSCGRFLHFSRNYTELAAPAPARRSGLRRQGPASMDADGRFLTTATIVNFGDGCGGSAKMAITTGSFDDVGSVDGRSRRLRRLPATVTMTTVLATGSIEDCEPWMKEIRVVFE